MTIRIIRGPKEYEILCRVCDSVAGFQQQDVVIATQNYINCPNCNSTILVGSNLVWKEHTPWTSK